MNYPRYIKRTFIILVISCHFVSLYATNTNSSYRYEGSVSLKYSFLASLGLETVHGVRFERPGIFLGGNSTFNNTGAMEFNSGTVLDVEAGSTFNTTVAPTFASGSQLNVAGNYNYTGTSSVTFGGDVNVSGSFVAKDLDVKLGTSGRITFNGATTFAAGSSGDFIGAMVIGKTLRGLLAFTGFLTDFCNGHKH